MPYYRYLNKQVFYKHNNSRAEISEKNAIIFIHGSGEHSFVWNEQLEGLEVNLRLIAIDLPSHGKSDTFEDLSLNLYVDAIKELVRELSLEKIILCGHSLGGAIVQDYFFKYPDDVISLILCSTGAKLRVLPVILENTLNNFEKFLNNIPIGAFYRKTSQKIKKSYIKEVAKIEPRVVHKDFKICDEFNVMDKIDSIEIPCLILVGDADKLTPVKYSKFFDEKIKDSTLKIIKKAGHSVMIEKPNKVNNAIKIFIRNKIEIN